MRKLVFLLLALIQLTVNAAQDPTVLAVQDTIQKLIENSTVRIYSTAPGSNGVTHVYGVQQYKGKDIFKAQFNATVKDKEIIQLNNDLIADPSTYFQTDKVYKAQEALRVYLNTDGLDGIWEELSNNKYSYTDTKYSDEAITLQLLWYVEGRKLIPAVDISMQERSHEHHYKVKVSLTDLKELHRSDMVVHCDFDHSISAPSQKVIPKQHSINAPTESMASASYQVFARPIESPNHGDRTVETDPHDTISSPFGWHSTSNGGGNEFTYTRGNNVYAYEDKANNNGPGYSPDGGSSLQFFSSFDKTQNADQYTDAAIVNLFYWNNLMHDVWYHYGFDEPSGNFQTNNYGNGGNQNDEVRAEAQDGSGTNNANFYTPADGSKPRMQMYIWQAGANQGDYLQVNSPTNAQGKYFASTAAFGPALTQVPITGDLVITDPERACGTIQNSSSLNGKIAFIERGSCTFVEKVRNAQSAGAIAVVIYDSTSNDPIFMGGTANDVTIPVVMIRKNDGTFLKNLVSSGVNVSLYDSSSSGNTTFDSDFDGGIIAHEYGHGISIRLTGGAANSECLSNQEQMGEGWSDFFSLVMTHEPGDEGSDVRGIGTYVTNQGVNGGGIRPYPYSTDQNASPYRYDDIKRFSVPHGVGSVWCAMLWDMYWAFIEEYGYDEDIYTGTGGNNMAMQLVIDGMKLQKCNPGFADGRDAILLADELNNDGENQKLIWEVFAARGLGYSADQGSSASRSDGTQAYDIPPFVRDELVIQKTAENVVVNGSEIHYTLTVDNLTKDTIFHVSLRDTMPEGVYLLEDQSNCDFTLENGIITFNRDTVFPDESFECTVNTVVKLQVSSAVSYKDDMESGDGDWTTASGENTNVWARVTTRSNSGDYSWFVQNATTKSDQSLILDLGTLTDQSMLSFYHRYNTEDQWDGGVVEFRTNGGSWVDAASLFIQNGYNGVISTNPDSYISGRTAFTGNSLQWVESIIDLSSFGGQATEVRFRMVSDAFVGGEGWYVDDLKLTNANAVTNTLRVSHDNGINLTSTAKTLVVGDAVQLSVEDRLNGARSFQIYPNPSEGLVQVKLNNQDEFSLKVLDISGRTVLEQNASGKTTVDLSKQMAGVYFIEVSQRGTLHRKKVLIY